MIDIEPKILSVSEFHLLVNSTLDRQVGEVLVQGEISDLKTSGGKWISFDLKDNESALPCFTSIYQVSVPIENGMQVKILGKPRIYAKYGKYSFQIIALEPIGEGSIKKAYEKLLKKLEQEGLFSEEFKTPLPKYPEKIGLITSKDGAALTDVKRVLIERWGGFELILKPTVVQGLKAEKEIIEAINYFNHHKLPDVIILTRGGGSLEDLQAFNSELMARTIFASKIPIIAAIGHERDITIAELVSDRRAATPSNAAQIAVPDRETVILELSSLEKTLKIQIENNIKYVRELIKNSEILTQRLLKDAKSRLEEYTKLLKTLSPEKILERGYSITKTNTGKILKSSKELSRGDKIETIFKDGKIISEII